MYDFRNMTAGDYEQSFDLWLKTEGMALSEADSKQSILTYLNRNPGLSFVCEDVQKIIGTILCGHDGRRGYIYHVAVSKNYRNQGIGKALVSRSLKSLNLEGIMKCHIFVIGDNEIGNHFWDKSEWIKRDGILIYSKNT